MTNNSHNLLQREYLFNQSLTYIATGIIISISQHLHNIPIFPYIGHIFVAASLLLILFSLIGFRWLNKIIGKMSPENNQATQLAEFLDKTFSSLLLICAFAVLTFDIYNELKFYIDAKAPQNTIDPLFSGMLVCLYIWVAMSFSTDLFLGT